MQYLTGSKYGDMAATGVLGPTIKKMLQPEGPPDDTGAYNMWKYRQGQIADFSKQLQSASSDYINSYNNFQQYQYGQSMINNIPYFASHGLQVNGGAYSAEASRQNAFYANQGITNAYNTRRQDAIAVDSAYAGGGTGQLGSLFGQGAMAQYDVNNRNSQLFGSSIGKLGMMAIGAYTGNPFLATAAMGGPLQGGTGGGGQGYSTPPMGANGYYGKQGNLDLVGVQ